MDRDSNSRTAELARRYSREGFLGGESWGAEDGGSDVRQRHLARRIRPLDGVETCDCCFGAPDDYASDHGETCPVCGGCGLMAREQDSGPSDDPHREWGTERRYRRSL